MADRVTLAATLRKARREAGYSIRELARFAGVHHSYLSRVERGAVPRPSENIMSRLVSPLGLEDDGGEPGDGGGGSGAEAQAGGGGRNGGGAASLAGLGLHRAPVRALLKLARELPDEHLELLAVQARAMLEQVKRKR